MRALVLAREEDATLDALASDLGASRQRILAMLTG
jgi:hypothetical protein